MIRLTQLNGTEIYLNPDLIEKMEEVPETHITLNNGNRYIVLEPTSVVVGRITEFKSRIFTFHQEKRSRRCRRKADDYHPFCPVGSKVQEGR